MQFSAVMVMKDAKLFRICLFDLNRLDACTPYAFKFKDAQQVARMMFWGMSWFVSHELAMCQLFKAWVLIITYFSRSHLDLHYRWT